jgi:hypothetical protein
MVIEIFQVFDYVDAHNMLALHRSTRCCGSSRRRFLQSFDKFAPRILTLFGLGQIATGNVKNLSRTHPVNLQFSIEGIFKGREIQLKNKRRIPRYGGLIY